MLLLAMIVYTGQILEWFIPTTVLSDGTISGPKIDILGTNTAGTFPIQKGKWGIDVGIKAKSQPEKTSIKDYLWP